MAKAPEILLKSSVLLNYRSELQYILDTLGVQGDISDLPGTMQRPFRPLSFNDLVIRG